MLDTRERTGVRSKPIPSRFGARQSGLAQLSGLVSLHSPVILLVRASHMSRTVSTESSSRFRVNAIRRIENVLRGWARSAAAALLATLLIPGLALAQQQGSISGKVMDPDGLALPGASVTLKA